MKAWDYRSSSGGRFRKSGRGILRRST